MGKELSDAAHRVLQGPLGDIAIKNVMVLADFDGDGTVSQSELLQVSFLSSSCFGGDVELKFEETVEAVFGKSARDSMTSKVRAELDANQNGRLSLHDVKARTRDLTKTLKI